MKTTNLSRKEAINYSIKKWEYLGQLSHLMLKNYSNIVIARYPLFEHFPSHCAMCKKYDREVWEPGITTDRCEKCPMFIKWGFNCYHPASFINDWNKNKTKYNAQIIVSELKSIKNPLRFWWNYKFKKQIKKWKKVLSTTRK